MIKISRTFTRPSDAVDWYQQSAAIPDELFLSRWTHYTDSGKVLVWDTVTSADGLTCEYIAIWRSLEDFHEYDHDPYLDQWWDFRDQYNNENGIQMGPKIVEFFENHSGNTTITLPAGNWNLADYSQ